MPTDRVFLTGAGGFIGSHVFRELRSAGYPVRVLLRDKQNFAHDDIVIGDLRRPGEFARALEGCRYVVHCAALYSFTPADRAALHETNVRGTAGLLEAARIAGIERAVVTSSSATLGPSRDGTPRTEADYAHDEHGSGYHRSKIEQERAAFAARVPVIALLPTAPVGPADAKPTPTGQLIVEFTRGRIFAKPPRGGMNIVPVEDVARAHVAALRQGRTGERYILGGENVTLDRLWEMLSQLTGTKMPSWRVPHAVALGIAHLDEARSRLTGARPFVPIEGVRMSRELMFADNSKAKRELDFHPGDAMGALSRAIAWYREHGYAG